VNRSVYLPCLALALFACGDDDDDGRTTTHEVVDATIEGLCEKLDSLDCAQPNCEEHLDLAADRCPAEAVQALLDCTSIASFECAGDPEIPRTAECESEFVRVASCSS
jgi:hypothetical protein